MLFSSNKYLSLFLQKTIVSIVLILFFGLAAAAQNDPLSAGSGRKKDTTAFHFDPLLLAAIKKPLKANPLLTDYIKPSKYELMHWPNYPLTAAQIEARNREWDRKYNQPFVQQVAGYIIESYVNSLLYGKKPVASRPRF